MATSVYKRWPVGEACIGTFALYTVFGESNQILANTGSTNPFNLSKIDNNT